MSLSLVVEMPQLPDAACKGTSNPDAFYSFNPRELEQARNICRRCPAIRDCLAWALTHTEEGIWAGTTEEQRKELRARHTDLIGAPA